MCDDVRETNRAHWEALAAVHGQDAYYDSEALIGGTDTLRGHEDAAVRESVGEVAGLDVLHLQCHIGFDSISLARRGAGVEVEFVEADATALPRGLHGRFDLVYSTMGVLCWIEDLAAWMRSVHTALRPGGRLVLVEIHPLYNMVGERKPLLLDFPTPPTARAASRSRAPTPTVTQRSPSRPRSSTPTRSVRRWRRRSAPACA